MNEIDRWSDIAPILVHAVGLPGHEVAAYLDDACRGDTDLRDQVQEYLDATASASRAIEEPSDPPVMPIGSILDHFTIIGILGRGGMGVVYLADDKKNQRPVALKVLGHSSGSHYGREHVTLAQLNHENIVHLYESGATPAGHSYFSMQYVLGINITAYCSQRNVSARAKLVLFMQLCEAVRYVHDFSYVHCDLKPSNIYVDRRGVVKLLDFGIAKEISDSDDGDITRSPDRKMSIPYASPEQVGYKLIRRQSDIYSLGVLLCVLLSGHLPFRGTSKSEQQIEILNGEALKPSAVAKPENAKDLTRALDAVVLKCLRLEPADRYESPKDLRVDIQRYLDGFPVHALRGSFGYSAWQYVKRNRKGLILATVFAAIFSVIGVEWFRSHDDAVQAAAAVDALDTLLNKSLILYKPADVDGFRRMLNEAGASVTEHISDASTKVQLLNTIGRTFQNAGLFDDAQRLHKAALDVASAKLEVGSLLRADCLDYLGVLARIRGDFLESELLLKRGRIIRERQEPKTSPSYTHELFQLAETLASEGKEHEAEALHRKDLELRRQAAQRPHATRDDAEGYAQSLYAEGMILADNNQDLALARSYLQESRKRRESLLQPDDPLIANTIFGLAKISAKTGNAEDAVRLQREVTDRFRRVYDDTNPQTIVADLYLGRFLLMAGRVKDARDTCASALERSQKSLGPQHPTTIKAALLLAKVSRAEGKTAEAEALVHDAAGWSSKTHDPLVAADISLAQAECDQGNGKYQLAEAGYSKALLAYASVGSEESDAALEAKQNLGEIEIGTHLFAQAERLLLDVYRHRNDTRTAGLIVNLYNAWGKPASAIPYQR